jgi:tRNA (cmo5U34)-methyltransferase
MNQPEMNQPDVTKLFGSQASLAYDDGIRKRIPGYETLHTTSYAILESALPDSARLLVVGAGTGQELVAYARARPQWQLVGVDPSLDMLERAREKTAAAGVAARVELHHGTTEVLPQETLFDAATALLVMHFLPDDAGKTKFLLGIAQRLRPGGLLLLADMTGQPGTAEFEALFAAWKVHWRHAHGADSGDARIEQEFAERRGRAGWIDERRHLALFAQTGFEDFMPFWSGLLFRGWLMRKR